MKKILSVIYGLLGWFGFLALFLYLIGFLGNFAVPKTVNSGVEGPGLPAILINLLLIAAFGIHHSVAARPGFKEWFTRFIPPHLERSTYVILSNLLLLLLFWQWRPITEVVWQIESGFGQVILYSLFALGWTTVVFSSFLINHFDLFGIRHVFLYLADRPYVQVPFKVRSLYKYVRNPLMVGWFIGFWSTPLMTVGHLVFAAGMTLYGLIGIFYEERTTAKFLGEKYRAYREKTPMLFPILRREKAGSGK